jgi:hypothetical protein
MYTFQPNVCRWEEHKQHKVAEHKSKWQSTHRMRISQCSGLQCKSATKNGIASLANWRDQFLSITKQTKLNQTEMGSFKSPSNCHGMLWSAHYSHYRQYEIFAASPYCLNPCTKGNQKHVSMSSVTSSLMYVYTLLHAPQYMSTHLPHVPQCSLFSTTCSSTTICPVNTFT